MSPALPDQVCVYVSYRARKKKKNPPYSNRLGITLKVSVVAGQTSQEEISHCRFDIFGRTSPQSPSLAVSRRRASMASFTACLVICCTSKQVLMGRKLCPVLPFFA